MKKLIWKELMEMRLIPLAYGALAMVILMSWDAYDASLYLHSHNPNDRMDIGACATIGLICILAAGLLPGSNGVSTELKTGTLRLLEVFPMGKKIIWQSKVIGGLLIMVGSIILSLACIGGLTVALFGMQPSLDYLLDLLFGKDIILWSLLVAATVLTVYFCSILVSTLIPSPLASTVVSIIVCCLLALTMASVGDIVAGHLRSPSLIYGFVATISLLGAVSACFAAFCLRETLLTFRSLWIVGPLVSAWIVCGSLGVAAFAKFDRIPPAKEVSDAPPQADYYNLGECDIGRKDPFTRQAFLTHLPIVGELKARASSPEIQVKSVRFVDRLNYCEVMYNYTPQLPTGPEHLTIEVQTSKGASLGKIALDAFKVKRLTRTNEKTIATCRFGTVTIGQEYTKQVPLVPKNPSDAIKLQHPVVIIKHTDEILSTSLAPAALESHQTMATIRIHPHDLPGYFYRWSTIYSTQGEYLGTVAITASKVARTPVTGLYTLQTYDCGRVKLNSDIFLDIPLNRNCDRLNAIQASVDTQYPAVIWTVHDGYPTVVKIRYLAKRVGFTETPVTLYDQSNKPVGILMVKAYVYK
jgi:ABC-type transport system involved in multi-copper enzyme maturation permease subunit